jgi:hypothetical protein
MLDDLTPALIFIDVLAFVGVFPLLIALQTKDLLPPFAPRQKAIAFIGVTSGLPLLSVVFWDHLGLPADPHSWMAVLMFWLAHITIIVAMFAAQFVASNFQMAVRPPSTASFAP